jgi:hypothetical protein
LARVGASRFDNAFKSYYRSGKYLFIRRNASSTERKFIGESLTTQFAISLMTPTSQLHGFVHALEARFFKVVMISSQPNCRNFDKPEAKFCFKMKLARRKRMRKWAATM